MPQKKPTPAPMIATQTLSTTTLRKLREVLRERVLEEAKERHRWLLFDQYENQTLYAEVLLQMKHEYDAVMRAYVKVNAHLRSRGIMS